MSAVRNTVSSLITFFPPVELVFAYGSAALLQHGRDRGKMLDLMFVVKDSESWHEANIIRHPSHYSFIKYLGPSSIVWLQRQPAGIYYNTLVTINSQLIKYGVISLEDFCKDLNEWEWLYASGRVQKPVTLLYQSSHDKCLLENSLKCNLKSAVLCSLLLLNKREVTELELFLAITGLSYMGDFRMVVGEDKNKVKNIVLPAVNDFRKLYISTLYNFLEPMTTNSNTYKVKIPLSVEQHKEILPYNVQKYLCKGLSLSEAITAIVTNSSKKQALKGVATAGFIKSFLYTSQKMKKMFNSIL